MEGLCRDGHVKTLIGDLPGVSTQVVVFAEETLTDIRQIAAKHAQRTGQHVVGADSYDDAATELQLVVRFIAAPVLSMGLKQ
jgi:hypothetical protein